MPLDICHPSDQSCQVDIEDLQEAVAAACITEVLAEIKVENSLFLLTDQLPCSNFCRIQFLASPHYPRILGESNPFLSFIFYFFFNEVYTVPPQKTAGMQTKHT